MKNPGNQRKSAMTTLAVFSHKLFRRTSSGLQTTGGFTILMDAIASYFDRVILCVPVMEDAGFRGAELTASNAHFHPLPHYQGRLGFLRAVPAMRREVLAVLECADLALVAMPGYVGALASILCQRSCFPVIQLVMGDWGQNVRVRRSNALTRWLALAMWSPILDRLMARLTRDVLTLFDGQILYGRGTPHHYAFVSSSIHQDAFYVHSGAFHASLPYRLLYVGRLSAEKGIPHLLEAVSLLVAEGDLVELHIVGTGALEGDLHHMAQALNIADRVIFHGYVPQGEALRQIYRESDVLVLPSLQDLQPKVLLEAMSQSLPVVATRVGGIPATIQDGQNGLLVPPARPDSMAAAARRVLADGELRRKLVEGGLTHARAHTVEREVAQMMQIIATHFDLKGVPGDPGS
jgi:glycosyltransferase involved in cell wall biosynthesis